MPEAAPPPPPRPEPSVSTKVAAVSIPSVGHCQASCQVDLGAAQNGAVKFDRARDAGSPATHVAGSVSHRVARGPSNQSSNPVTGKSSDWLSNQSSNPVAGSASHRVPEH
eukprot:7059173-Pyramimonas_sp.AAC.1